MSTKVYYFACRVRPPGSWVVEGPYEYEEAKKRREKAKAPDMEVGNVFSANSRKEAEESVRGLS